MDSILHRLVYTSYQAFVQMFRMTNIIISRKGFDSGAGGCASPILPDGRTAISLPIPGDISSKWEYDGLIEQSTGLSYRRLIEELRPGCAKGLRHCHLECH